MLTLRMHVHESICVYMTSSPLTKYLLGKALKAEQQMSSALRHCRLKRRPRFPVELEADNSSQRIGET